MDLLGWPGEGWIAAVTASGTDDGVGPERALANMLRSLAHDMRQSLADNAPLPPPPAWFRVLVPDDMLPPDLRPSAHGSPSHAMGKQ